MGKVETRRRDKTLALIKRIDLGKLADEIMHLETRCVGQNRGEELQAKRRLFMRVSRRRRLLSLIAYAQTIEKLGKPRFRVPMRRDWPEFDEAAY